MGDHRLLAPARGQAGCRHEQPPREGATITACPHYHDLDATNGNL